jgi:hypothetical protein
MLINPRLLYNRSHSTITKHLWILSKLLNMKEPSTSDGPKGNPSSLSKRLLRYVIATCYRKMIRRLGHRTLSQPYIQSLKQVTTFQFDESKLDQASEGETANDRLFLLQFVLTGAWRPCTKFPKLIEQAKVAEDGKTFQLYTKDTCAEFHELLIELLLCFETSLNELAKARGDPKVPTQGSEEFKQKVGLVLFCGCALQQLAKGAALRAHLKTIAPLLKSWHLRARTLIPAPGEEQEELDDGLKAVQPFTSIEGIETPLWTSYIDWLRLMLAHFDAVGILVGYVTGPNFQHNTISIQILVTAPVDQHLLPWRELFTDSTLFPTETVWDPLSAKADAGISNISILEFLNNALEPFTTVNAVKTLWSKKELKLTIKNLENLKSSNFLGWGECATKLLVKLKGLDGLPELDSNLFHEISDDIQSLWESARFFASLGDAQDFSGTLHSEACLTSLLDKTTTVSRGILMQMKVGYVSNLFLSSRSYCL